MLSPKQKTGNANLHYTRTPWDWSHWLFLLLLIPLIAIFYGTLLLFCYKLFSPSFHTALLVAKPAISAWYYAGLFLSIGTVGIMIKPLYESYQRKYYKPLPFLLPKPIVEGHPLIRVVSLVMVTATFLFSAFLFDNYLAVYPTSVVVNPLSGWGRSEYALKDIKDVDCLHQINRSGNATYHYVIRFTDGNSYYSRNNMLANDRAFGLLATQANLQVDTLSANEK